MNSLRRPIVTLSDSVNLCQAIKSEKGTGSDKRLRIETAMLRQVFCGAQGATLACHNSHYARRRLDDDLGPLSFVACGDERASPRVCDLRFQHRREDKPCRCPRACTNCRDGNWISADSISKIEVWKVWSEHSLNPVESAVSGIDIQSSVTFARWKPRRETL